MSRWMLSGNRGGRFHPLNHALARLETADKANASIGPDFSAALKFRGEANRQMDHLDRILLQSEMGSALSREIVAWTQQRVSRADAKLLHALHEHVGFRIGVRSVKPAKENRRRMQMNYTCRTPGWPRAYGSPQ